MKVLIVEDDQVIRCGIATALNKWGLETVIVNDFEAVRAIFDQEAPQLVMMDINLPAYDGFHWCHQIRQVSKVPILFLSSRNTAMDIVMAVNMGGDDFVQKPFQMDVLMAKTQALLRRTYDYTEMGGSLLEHEGIILHLSNWQLQYKEQSIELTKTEFIIVKLLLEQSGHIVGRKKNMRKLWADEKFIDENTLTVNVGRLRKKLADIDLEDLIITKKGKGYLIQ